MRFTPVPLPAVFRNVRVIIYYSYNLAPLRSTFFMLVMLTDRGMSSSKWKEGEHVQSRKK